MSKVLNDLNQVKLERSKYSEALKLKTQDIVPPGPDKDYAVARPRLSILVDQQMFYVGITTVAIFGLLAFLFAIRTLSYAQKDQDVVMQVARRVAKQQQAIKLIEDKLSGMDEMMREAKASITLGSSMKDAQIAKVEESLSALTKDVQKTHAVLATLEIETGESKSQLTALDQEVNRLKELRDAVTILKKELLTPLP